LLSQLLTLQLLVLSQSLISYVWTEMQTFNVTLMQSQFEHSKIDKGLLHNQHSQYVHSQIEMALL